MTTAYDDLKARAEIIRVPNGVAISIVRELFDAIERESKAADMIAEERDAWEKRAKALEADNAALREELEWYQQNSGVTRDSRYAAIDAAIRGGKVKE